MAEILSSHIIHQHPGRYVAWPTIGATAGGELLVSFSGDRAGHTCPYGKTFLMRSSDRGESWSEPILINDTPLDDRDAGLCVCPDGTAVLSWFTTWRSPADPDLMAAWRDHLAAIPLDVVDQWTRPGLTDSELVRRGFWLRRSVDNGLTWGDATPAPVSAPHGVQKLADGRLVYVGMDGHRRDDRSSSLACAESVDGGRSWAVVGRVSMFPDAAPSEVGGVRYLGEPHVVEVAPGHLLGMARHEEQPYVEGRPTGRLWQFESRDGGRTWTEPRETPLLGKPPHLLGLRDGRILVTYGYRHAPFGQRACVTADGGRTWEYRDEIVLRDDAPNHDLGYPATVECDDGSLLSVYYQRERLDGMPSIMATRWRL